jgi:hypothetical protein
MQAKLLSRRIVFSLLAIASMGCDRLRDELPSLVAEAPPAAREQVNEVKVASPLPRLARRLEQQLKPPAPAANDAIEQCALAHVPNTSEDHPAPIVLVAVDTRTQTKNLIPRRVTERLETGERMLLASVVDASQFDAATQRAPATPASASSLTLDDLKRIEQQRYLGVFYLGDYQGPSLILRMGKIRREWLSGYLSARFVLVDTQSQTALCTVSVRVVNDVKTAPIRSRLQAETRARLERELGDSLRNSVGQSLERWRNAFTWPEAAMGG